MFSWPCGTLWGGGRESKLYPVFIMRVSTPPFGGLLRVALEPSPGGLRDP